ncbi:Uncharacterised protein [Legionella feeleii]|uniref:Uncharacterized protein n=1 Tax=Legionella feeleii TaxID=453 RepID=A0A2X1T1G0_9GAMM|nr:Uncharacterised protein [Legionella feeleii]
MPLVGTGQIKQNVGSNQSNKGTKPSLILRQKIRLLCPLLGFADGR